MHEYMTRHMVALKPFTYAGWTLEPGDPFVATPDDAGYFTRHGRAKEAAAQAPATNRPAVAPPAEAAAPVVIAAPAPQPAAEDVPPPDAGDAAAPKSRRGRPTNAERLARQAAEAGADAAAVSES